MPSVAPTEEPEVWTCDDFDCTFPLWFLILFWVLALLGVVCSCVFLVRWWCRKRRSREYDPVLGNEPDEIKIQGKIKCGLLSVSGSENMTLRQVTCNFLRKYNQSAKNTLQAESCTSTWQQSSFQVVILPCLISTRLGTDIERTVQSCDLDSSEVAANRILLVFHHRAPHNATLTPTKSIMGNSYIIAQFKGVIDVVFESRDNGSIPYDCEQNKIAMKELDKLCGKK